MGLPRYGLLGRCLPASELPVLSLDCLGKANFILFSAFMQLRNKRLSSFIYKRMHDGTEKKMLSPNYHGV